MIAGVLGVLAISPLAHATLLLPSIGAGPSGTTESPTPNTTQNSGGKPLGTLVVSTGLETMSNTNMSGTAVLKVTFEEEVFKEASGTLDFYYEITTDKPTLGKGETAAALETLDASDFSNWTVGAGTAGNVTSLPGMAKGTIDPSSVSRDATPGDSVTWSFAPSNLGAGSSSLVLVVTTPATTYKVGDASADGSKGTSLDFSGFAPGTDTVPEPVSIILGGSVLSLSAFWIRRRRNAANAKA
jgi:hypothetical protein